MQQAVLARLQPVLISQEWKLRIWVRRSALLFRTCFGLEIWLRDIRAWRFCSTLTALCTKSLRSRWGMQSCGSGTAGIAVEGTPHGADQLEIAIEKFHLAVVSFIVSKFLRRSQSS
eukprot:4248183-Amphidinium_carterae.1